MKSGTVLCRALPLRRLHSDQGEASTITDSDQGNPSRRQVRQAYSNGHTATATTYNKHPVTDALQQQLRTMMSAIQGRKAFVQCAILVAVVLLALTANAAAQFYDPCDCRSGCRWVWGTNICYVRDPHNCGWANRSRLRHGEKWRRCPY